MAFRSGTWTSSWRPSGPAGGDPVCDHRTLVSVEEAATKLDAQLRDLVTRARAQGGAAEHPVSVLVRGEAQFTPEQLEDLSGCGIRIRKVFSDVLTADAPVGSLTAVAERPYVVAIASSGPLFPEGETA